MVCSLVSVSQLCWRTAKTASGGTEPARRRRRIGLYPEPSSCIDTKDHKKWTSFELKGRILMCGADVWSCGPY